MSQFLWALYKDRSQDPKGRDIIEELIKNLVTNHPNDVPTWTKYYESNLKLTKELATRIQNNILRTTLENRNKDTEDLLKKLQSGKGTLEDIKSYNSRTLKELKEALGKIH